MEKQAKVSLEEAHSSDGRLEITLSPDNMEARCDFIPPEGKGLSVSQDYVSAFLKNAAIHHGIIRENIENAVREAGESRRPLEGILVAKGDLPQKGESAYFMPAAELEEKKLPDDELARIDYREISPFVMVKKGDLLASLIPAVEGKDGRDVHGTVVPKTIVARTGVSGGENTVAGEKDIRSAIDGRLLNTKNVLSVDEVLVIKGQVGYGTGHISFPGDIIIEGPVADGFKVHSGGSALIKQTFDVTEINVKKDLIVTGGIIGRKPALVKVGGSLKAKFIQNCHVACREKVIIETGILNSSVFTLDTLKLGDRGRVLGGEIHSVHGVKAAAIGTESGKAVEIHCGVDFTVKQEINKLNYKFRLMVGKLEKLLDLIAKSEEQSPQRIKMTELERRLEDEIDKVNSRLRELLPKVNADEKAAVEVSGKIAAGTLIEICEFSLVADASFTRVKIRLDRSQGKLIREPLK